jgi:hypothetical protein
MADEVVCASRGESLAHLGPPEQSTASPQLHCSIMHRRGRRDDSSIEIVL